MCLVLLELELCLFFSNIIELMLSWYITVSLIFTPCSCAVHMACGSTSCNPITSLSVELWATNFCFEEVLLPNDSVPPVCPFISGWTAYDASTRHLTFPVLSPCSLNCESIVPLMYWFPKSTSYNYPHPVVATSRKGKKLPCEYLVMLFDSNIATAWQCE